eukprot:6211818-Pleurochrysis_carterae.AAC.2
MQFSGCDPDGVNPMASKSCQLTFLIMERATFAANGCVQNRSSSSDSNTVSLGHSILIPDVDRVYQGLGPWHNAHFFRVLAME